MVTIVMIDTVAVGRVEALDRPRASFQPSHNPRMPSPPATPLTPLSYAILLSLGDQDRHGYSIVEDVIEQTRGAVRPGTGTLYAALRRLREEGFIVDSERELEPDEDPRRKYYAITEQGREAARTEARRMMDALAVARASHSFPATRPPGAADLCCGACRGPPRRPWRGLSPGL